MLGKATPGVPRSFNWLFIDECKKLQQHDGVMAWEAFPHYRSFVRGIQRYPNQRTSNVELCFFSFISRASCLTNSHYEWKQIKWKHFPRYWPPLCGEFTDHRWIPITKASNAELWCFLICAGTNGWVNNRDTGGLRRHRAHCDVIKISHLNPMINIKWAPEDMLRYMLVPLFISTHLKNFKSQTK